MTTKMIAIVGGTLLAAGEASAQASATIDWKPLTLTSEAGETAEAETGWLVVPQRHGQPGPTIKLALLRLRTSAAQPQAPLLYLAGGPGNSGLERARGELFPLLQALRADRDVVVFDQRGTGRSEPSLLLPGTVGLPPTLSIASPQALQHLVEGARAGAARLREAGIDLAAYDTARNADDVEAIRQALGVPRIALWGHSYGSHLGLAVLKRHGAHVERAILGGVNGLSQRFRLPADGEAWLEAVAARVRETPGLGARVPDLTASLRRELARLRARPAEVQLPAGPVRVGAEEVQALIAVRSGDLEFVRALPLMVGQMAAGRYENLARNIQRTLRDREWGTAMAYTMHLASGVSAARRAAIEKQATAVLGNAINYPFADGAFAAAWSVTDLGDGFREEVRSDVPVLLLSGALDGRTPPAEAERVRTGLARATHLVFEGAAHDPYVVDPRALAAMLAFLRGETPTATRLRQAVTFRSPDEPDQLTQLREALQTGGATAAAARLAEMARQPGTTLTSFVPGTLAFGLLREQQRPKDARVLLEAALTVFPREPFLLARLGEACQALGDSAAARDAFARAVELDPFDRRSAVAGRVPTPR